MLLNLKVLVTEEDTRIIFPDDGYIVMDSVSQLTPVGEVVGKLIQLEGRKLTNLGTHIVENSKDDRR